MNPYGGFGMNPYGGMQQFGGMGMGANPPPAQQNPAELYATQIQQIKDMGFFNEALIIQALQATGGNVEAAVERLLSSL